MTKRSGEGLLVRGEGLVVSRAGRVILDHVDVVAEPGVVSVVTGASGAGKSTLLWVLAGLIEPVPILLVSVAVAVYFLVVLPESVPLPVPESLVGVFLGRSLPQPTSSNAETAASGHAFKRCDAALMTTVPFPGCLKPVLYHSHLCGLCFYIAFPFFHRTKKASAGLAFCVRRTRLTSGHAAR